MLPKRETLFEQIQKVKYQTSRIDYKGVERYV